MEQYLVDKVVGEGTYGIVYRAVEKGTDDHVAIKKFKTIGDEQLSKREIQACSMLSHPYIVCYRNSFRHEGLLHLVFDHVPDSMNKLLNRNRRGVEPVLAQRLIYQLCQALQYCHANHIIHRDIKPDNILIDENGDIRVCDFGVARTIQFEGDPLSDYVATRWYRPPEQELRMDRYSFDADIWSVGCVLMELLTGRPLFPGNSQIDQLNLIQEYLGPLPPALAARLPRGVTTSKSPTKSFDELLAERVLPEGTLDFLAQTVQLEPKLRLSAAGCLAHPFLKPLRDADQREKKTRQLEEKQRRSRNGAMGSPDSEDGIEEEIPGGSRVAEAKSPGPTPLYRGNAGSVRPFDFKDANTLKRSATPQAKPMTRESKHKSESKRKSKTKHHCHDDAENPADCDSDYIQEEIIELDEMSLAEPVSPHGCGGRVRGKRSLDDHREAEDFCPPLRSPSKTNAGVGGGRRRRQAKDEPMSGDHESYEDDFED